MIFRSMTYDGWKTRSPDDEIDPMLEAEMHICEWCRFRTHEDELTHIRDIDQYLCERCEEEYIERKAQAYDRHR